ncbi:MAG: bile acid:sodium symporter family protein [Planctomycetota bacterium]|jgi:BASS family bile acid:Na+ symporter
MNFFKLVERWFVAFSLGAMVLGLLVPQSGYFMKDLAVVWLAGILFFTGLKLDFRTAISHLRRPWLVAYAAVVLMIAFPFGVYGLARLFLPTELAYGVVIVAAMPAGLAASSLTDISRGRAELALIVTLITSLACPLATPWVIRTCTGISPGEGWAFMWKQARFLALILFTPMAAAYVVKRLFPKPVAKFREAYTGLAMLSLSLLILAAMSGSSEKFMEMIRSRPAAAAGLFAFMFGFSALMHTAGYLMAPWRPAPDRAALSVCSAYVNNGLAIVFATKFFVPIEGIGAAALLPAVLIEVPMILAIRALKSWMERGGGLSAESGRAVDGVDGVGEVEEVDES